MITITRKTAKLVRTVFRRAFDVRSRTQAPPLLLQAGADGIHIRAATATMAASFCTGGSLPEETLAIPYELLADCEGPKHEPVQIERLGNGRIVAGWQDHGVPIVMQCDVSNPSDVLDKIPPLPTETRENPPAILTALRDAMDVADGESARYAIRHVRLCGSDGSITGTDGRRLLVQTGFDLPIQNEALIPRTTLFGCRELPTDAPVMIGDSDGWVMIRTGPWTFQLKGDSEGKFPSVESVVPKPETAMATATIGESDATFLLKALSRLPCNDPIHQGVTFDLNGSVAIRAQGEDNTSVTEIVLRQSSRAGETVCIHTNRQYLAQALKLGFRKLHVFQPDAPVLCCDHHRKFIWGLLEPDVSIKPTDKVVRIESPLAEPQTRNRNTKPKRKLTNNMLTTRKNGHADDSGTATRRRQAKNHTPQAVTPEMPSPATGSLNQAIALRETLRTAARQTGELIKAIKAEKRQSKIVRSTLASLRSLETLEV